ncbi:zinc-dependent metalloprotease [Actinomyces vulturis]|uniref:zinc-dependent metalloprotease n=1 Tax=Actinomyces vulturis TaxID=1857645 RepID=UPI000AB5C9C7|nr:zinc-dependent metalloprotease [Actinomyces vulturis]
MIPRLPVHSERINWSLARRIAQTLTPAGPRVAAPQRQATVDLLRRSAHQAPQWVGEITGLNEAAQRAQRCLDVKIVDRAGWIDINTTFIRSLLPDSIALSAQDIPGMLPDLAGVEVAALMGVLSTRVLGQVHPIIDEPAHDFSASGTDIAGGKVSGDAEQNIGGCVVGQQENHGVQTCRSHARMILVAPNVLATRDELDLDMMDFPSWVALHEATHAVQLAQAPWLAQYLTGMTTRLIASLGPQPSKAPHSFVRRMNSVTDAVRSLASGESDVLSLTLNEEQWELLDSLMSAMAFLEGQAEAVMDGIHPATMPSVHRIRASVASARHTGIPMGHSDIETYIRKIVGIDTKYSQYSQGTIFARTVISHVGHEGLAAALASPDQLPTMREISHPNEWIERIHG